jgi:hypothetical protein
MFGGRSGKLNIAVNTAHPTGFRVSQILPPQQTAALTASCLHSCRLAVLSIVRLCVFPRIAGNAVTMFVQGKLCIHMLTTRHFSDRFVDNESNLTIITIIICDV